MSRLLKRIGEIEDFTGKEIGGKKTRDGQGIKFENYGAFKASLGRAGVDLQGPRAPHMLQSIVVGTTFERVSAIGPGGNEPRYGLNDRPQPADTVVIGIYGDEAGRATAHNTGENPRWKSRHQRRFLGASPSDVTAMVNDIAGRIKSRIEQMAKLLGK